MGSLNACLLKHRVPADQAERMRALAEEYRSRGYADPEKMAVEDLLQELQDERADIIKQVVAAGGEDPDVETSKAEEIEIEAHRAATSPANDLPEPTEAQREAGNFQKGHVALHGMRISIEHPKGSKRRPEWPELSAHYGYVRQTEGPDDEQVDVFIGEHPESTVAYVIDQIDPATGKFDEHKIVLGAGSTEEARQVYLSNYPKGWRGLGAITELPMQALRAWLERGSTKPLGQIPIHRPSKLAELIAKRRGTPKAAQHAGQPTDQHAHP